VLIFCIEGLQNFTLYCPCHYPEYNSSEDNFFVEADLGLQLWCNALNEYLLDTAGKQFVTFKLLLKDSGFGLI
jgi:baculoviral IAP repeat-containing protein 6